MCICKAGHILVLIGKRSKVCKNVNKLSVHYLHSITHYDNVCVITYITACSAKMNNALCLGTALSVCVNVRHNIVAELLLFFSGIVKINIIDMSRKFVYLFLCYLLKSELHLCPCKSYPQSAECRKLLLSRECKLHFLAGISRAERAFVGFVVCHYK